MIIQKLNIKQTIDSCMNKNGGVKMDSVIMKCMSPKSTFMMDIALNYIKENKLTVEYSVEMGSVINVNG